MKINYSFIFLIILSLYTGYFNELLLFIISLLFHELGHLLFIILFKVKISKFSISIYGGTLELDNTSYEKISKYKKIIIYISGVLVNLLLYFLFMNYNFGKYNLLLFIFNLIPIYPLDGYNILNLLFNKTFVYNISIISLLFLIMFSIYNNSIGLLIIIVILIIKNIIYFKSKDKIFLKKIIKTMV